MARNQGRKRLDQPNGGALSELDKALADLAASTAVVDAPPEGWKTVQQWSEESGQAYSTVGRKLAELVRKGRWERTKFRVRCDDGRRIEPRHHYRRKPD